jgi:hypothetical protein
MNSINCPNCGAQTTIEDNQVTTTCRYCNATFSLENPKANSGFAYGNRRNGEPVSYTPLENEMRARPGGYTPYSSHISEEPHFSVGLCIFLLLFFWPGAIIQLIVYQSKKSAYRRQEDKHRNQPPNH